MFSDYTMEALIEIIEKDGSYTIFVDGQEYPLPLSDMKLADSPEWVRQDVMRLLVRKELRKQRLDDLTSGIMFDAW